MSRRPRIKLEHATAYYHVMTRTAQQEMYLSEKNCPGFKANMLEIFKNMSDIYYVSILAWVIMDNHYHLCLEVQHPPKDPADLQVRFERLQKLNKNPRRWQPNLADSWYERLTDLSRFMSSVNSRTARAFNRARETKGHLWGGRYKSKVIENSAAVLRVMCYIEHNPVKAGVSKVPSAYRWCSAGNLKNKQPLQEVVALPAIDFLGIVEPDQRKQTYIEWVDEMAAQLYPIADISRRQTEAFSHNLDDRQLKACRRQFAEGEPENWSVQGFGSPAFILAITLAEKFKIQKMTMQRRKNREQKRARASPATGTDSFADQ